MVYCRYFKVSKVFDVDVLGFQIEFIVDFDFFWLGDCLGYFFEKISDFSSNLLVTLVFSKVNEKCR